MARAKNIARAEARRRYRQQHQLTQTDGSADGIEDLDDLEAIAPPPPRRSSFRMPDVRGDLRALPGMFRTRKLLWLPFILVVAAFVLGMADNRSMLPGDLGQVVGLFTQLVLPPQSLLAYFLAGFIAPRGSYLVGLMLGLLTGPLYAIFYVEQVPILISRGVTVPPGYVAPVLVDALPLFTVQGAVFGLVAGGFAAWYRNFLRSSQERAKQNRIDREQQSRIKAREQAIKDRDAAREAARAAREQRKPTA